MNKPPLPANKRRGNPLSEEEQARLSVMGRQATGTTKKVLQERLLRHAFGAIGAEIGLAHEKHAVEAIVEGLMSIAPQDGPEGLLAVQMVTGHEAAMECLRRAMDPGSSSQERELTSNMP